MSLVCEGRFGVLRTVTVYAATMVIPLLVFNHFLDERANRPSEHPLADSLPIKTAYYQAHAAEFDLVLLGDSRTYINLQPHEIDARLGTRSVNLGMWGHYFATQHGQLCDIIGRIPKNATVLWSIGHRNFQPVDESVWRDLFPPAQITPFNPDGRWFIDRYPVGIQNAPWLLWWGYPWHAVKRNIVRFGPLGELLETTRDWRYTLNRRRNNPVASFSLIAAAEAAPRRLEAPEAVVPSFSVPASTPCTEPTEDELLALRRRYIDDRYVASVETARSDDKITSLIVYTTQGSYYRIEVDPEFFRHKQRELAELIRRDRKPDAEIVEAYAPSPPFWRNFLAILDLFQAHGIHLVVNEVDEAPFIYEAWGGREELRRFMAERVAPEVRARGIPYLCVDVDRLSDAEYFDMDHFNSAGTAIYAEMLAEALRPYLSGGR